jgi:hypothetical protein
MRGRYQCALAATAIRAVALLITCDTIASVNGWRRSVLV